MSPDGPSASQSVGSRSDLARWIAQTVDSFPGVRRSTSAAFGTLFPGGRVAGVVLGNSIVTVHIDVSDEMLGESLAAIGERIQSAVLQILEHAGDRRAVAVSIDDIVSET